MKEYILDEGKLKNLCDENEHIFDFLSSPFAKNLKRLVPYKEVIVTDEYKLDLLAYQEYRDYNKWWILAYYNDIIDPFEKIKSKKIGLLHPLELDMLITSFLANKELE